MTALAAGRSPAEVEISQEWPGIEQADEYVEAGVGVFNLQGDAFALDSPEGLKNIQEVIAWRDKTNG